MMSAVVIESYLQIYRGTILFPWGCAGIPWWDGKKWGKNSSKLLCSSAPSPFVSAWLRLFVLCHCSCSYDCRFHDNNERAGTTSVRNITSENLRWPERTCEQGMRTCEQGVKTCSFLQCSFLDLSFLLECGRAMGREL